MLIKIPVSAGELTDKITILEIKTTKIKDTVPLKAAENELNHLNRTLNKMLPYKILKGTNYNELRKKLLNVNKKLWNIENKIRACESQKKFDSEFIKLARSVYIYNDKRSEIKNKINQLTGSELIEVKQYSKY